MDLHLPKALTGASEWLVYILGQWLNPYYSRDKQLISEYAYFKVGALIKQTIFTFYLFCPTKSTCDFRYNIFGMDTGKIIQNVDYNTISLMVVLALNNHLGMFAYNIWKEGLSLFTNKVYTIFNEVTRKYYSLASYAQLCIIIDLIDRVEGFLNKLFLSYQ